MNRAERVACYIRVSTQEQKLHGISLDAQRDKLSEYANVHNLKIVEWYEDEGVSGRKLIKNRPALQRMLKDAKKNKFDRIIFIKLDRFFRSVAEYHECMKIIDPIVWTATEEKYDLTTANGRAFVNMKLTIAELEADQTGERIRLVNDYKVKTGQAVTGSVPWSHKIVTTQSGKKVVVNPDTKDECIAVIDYYIQTHSLRKTLEYANPYHKFYDLKGLKKWLSNPLLIGSYHDNNSYCEPLISVDKYNKVQSILPNNIRQPRCNTPIFSKLLLCPECGRHLVAVTSKQTVKGVDYRYVKYRCDNSKRCGYTSVLSENLIEKCMLDNLEPELSKLSISSYNVTCKEKTIDTTSIKAEIDRLNYMFEKGRINVNDYDKKYDSLQVKLTEAEYTPEVDADKLAKINEILSSGWRSIYEALDREHKRDFWHNIFKDVMINKDGRVYTISDIYL